MKETGKIYQEIHEKALELSKRYKRAEAELIEVLQEVDKHRVYRVRGHKSLFEYVRKELRLSEGVAYNLIVVSRKAAELPALMAELRKGTITLTNARMIAPVLRRENQAMWLEKAAHLSQRKLEKEVVKVRPQSGTPEHASYISEDRLKVELGFWERDMLKLRRAQDLVSQERRAPATLEDTIMRATGEFLKRHDPVQLATRQWAKKGLNSVEISYPRKPCQPVALQVGTKLSNQDRNPDQSPGSPGTAAPSLTAPYSGLKRVAIPANILHQVRIRDQGRCTFITPQGERCNERRQVEIHHKIPVSDGGSNTPENLATLCATHHDHVHSPPG